VTRVRGSIKKIAPNNYQIRIGYTENGKRREYKRNNYATKRDADIALANAQVTLGKGRAIDASRQTLGVFLEGWLDIYAKSRGVKPSTLVKTREHLHAYIVPRLGARSMRELKPQLIARFTSDLLEGGRLNPKQDGSRELSNKTVRNILGTLSVALTQAVEWGLLPENPCSRIDLPRKTRPELVTLSGEQVAQFLQVAHEHRDPMLAVWLLVFTTGMRRGELAGLRWQDIDLVAGTATVTQTRQVLGGEVITGTPKTRAGSRTVTLDSWTIDELARAKDAQEQAARILGYWSSELVATDLDGRAVHPDALLKRFRRALRAAGLPEIRLHDGRHTYVAYALENGVSVHIVAARVGHSSASFTYDTYAKSIPAADRNASSIVENALAKLIDNERVLRTRTGREVREKDAKSRELHEHENLLRPYNPINIGLHGHDEQDLWGGRGVSNPRPPGPQPGALTN